MIQTVLMQGDGRMNEDALIINHDKHIYGVIDGVTSFEGSDYNGKTPGKLAAEAVKTYFAMTQYDDLNTVTEAANLGIQNQMALHAVTINHPKDRFQCCHTAVQVFDDRIDWTGSADCVIYAIGDTVEQIYPEFKEKEESDRIKLWRTKYPEDYEAGRWPKEWIDVSDDAKAMANQPGGYSVMNGDPMFKDAYAKGSFAAEGLTHILLTTDGFYDIESIGIEQFVRKAVEDLDGFLDYMMAQEQRDIKKTLYPRVKVHDDKAAVLITL